MPRKTCKRVSCGRASCRTRWACFRSSWPRRSSFMKQTRARTGSRLKEKRTPWRRRTSTFWASSKRVRSKGTQIMSSWIAKFRNWKSRGMNSWISSTKRMAKSPPRKKNSLTTRAALLVSMLSWGSVSRPGRRRSWLLCLVESRSARSRPIWLNSKHTLPNLTSLQPVSCRTLQVSVVRSKWSKPVRSW